MLDTATGKSADGAAPETVDTPLGPVPVSRRSCPSCGAANDDVAGGRYSRPPWSIKECPACGFVYLDPVPRYEALIDTLSWEKSRESENRRRADERPVSYRVSASLRKRNRLFPRKDIARLAERYAPPGNVVDIGCAEGGRAMTLAADYTPFGVEISAELAAQADGHFSTRGGRCVLAPALQGLRTFEDGFFTAAMLRSFLEHETQPREVLAELARTLTPGGVAIVKVPNYGSLNRRLTGRKWCGFRFPDHVNYFTPESLRAMAGRQGFDVSYGATGAMPTSDNMWALLRRR
ncbi:class I SAM-dependent methyltransferase [Microbaculum marinum]|uniref:Class I SAM-dependent methyltransferase n=1 Tax=Microbaculum marinum TaxID=1764581 RepID=A0AAW9RP94_9HYPH